VTGLQTEPSGFDSWKGHEIFLFSMVSRLVLGPIQLPIRASLSQAVKQQGHKADHSSPFSAKVMNSGANTPLPHMPSWYNLIIQVQT
jgi:hypothetical protein